MGQKQRFLHNSSKLVEIRSTGNTISPHRLHNVMDDVSLCITYVGYAIEVLDALNTLRFLSGFAYLPRQYCIRY